MRKLTAAAFLSLDGVMQAPGGPEEDPTGGFTLGGWSANYWDDVMGQAMAEAFATPSDLLLGRKTYEIFAGHWPFVGDDDPIGKVFGEVTKYVATTARTPLTWKNSVALNGDVFAEVKRLKAGEGRPLLTQGSSDLLQTLIGADLIDEYALMVFPLILGNGKHLFGRGAVPAGLKLQSATVATSGVIISRYVRSGAIVPGSFALTEPTPQELARRERMRREG